jgi:hypothetical protein
MASLQEAISGPVLGIAATNQSKAVNIRARRGVIIATEGHSSNVNFRRIFDPRLTDEYQVPGGGPQRKRDAGPVLRCRVRRRIQHARFGPLHHPGPNCRYERGGASADDLEGLMMELAAVSKSGATFGFQQLPPFPIPFWRCYA